MDVRGADVAGRRLQLMRRLHDLFHPLVSLLLRESLVALGLVDCIRNLLHELQEGHLFELCKHHVEHVAVAAKDLCRLLLVDGARNVEVSHLDRLLLDACGH